MVYANDNENTQEFKFNSKLGYDKFCCNCFNYNKCCEKCELVEIESEKLEQFNQNKVNKIDSIPSNFLITPIQLLKNCLWIQSDTSFLIVKLLDFFKQNASKQLKSDKGYFPAFIIEGYDRFEPRTDIQRLRNAVRRQLIQLNYQDLSELINDKTEIIYPKRIKNHVFDTTENGLNWDWEIWWLLHLSGQYVAITEHNKKLLIIHESFFQEMCYYFEEIRHPEKINLERDYFGIKYAEVLEDTSINIIKILFWDEDE